MQQEKQWRLNTMNKTIPIFISHRGCPNDCVFCNQKKITGVQQDLTMTEILNQIENALNTIDNLTRTEVAFFGGSFTAIDLSLQTQLLQLVQPFIERGEIQSIRVSTRPDAINQEILDFLKRYHVDIIELGVQSMDNQILKLANRGHDQQSVYTASSLILKNGFKLGLQMMIGLPGDSIQTIEDTVNRFVDIGPDFVRIYPVLVIKNTELESLFKNKRYTPWNVEDAAMISAKCYKKFVNNHIKVIRIGLQGTKNITMGADVVAGPFHPAFGEIVYSLIYREIIQQNMNKNPGPIWVEVSNKEISKLIGNNKSNRKYFFENYGKNIIIHPVQQANYLSVDGNVIPLGDYFNLES